LHARQLFVWLERPIDVVPQRTVLLLVVIANIIRPPCRLHEQHHVAVSNGNVLNPRLPLVGVPGMFLQDRCYLVDSLGTLFLESLISDDPGEHMAGMFQADAGRGITASVKSTANAISDTVAVCHTQ
jgi:hypothetical protein